MFLLSPNSRSPSLCSLCLASPTQISIAPSYGRMDLTMASIPIPMQPSMQQRITDPTPLPRCGRSCMFLPLPSFRINLPAYIIISITNYNVVIAVLSMFIMLAKVCQYLEALDRYLTSSPGRYVHPALLAPAFLRHRPRHTPCALCSLNRLPSGIRYERSKASAAWCPLVHHKTLLSGP
jgi:hypothetical protein